MPSSTATPSEKPRSTDSEEIKSMGFLDHLEELRKRIPGAQGQPHTTIRGGGHFLQEDCGEDLARTVIDFVKRTGK